MSTSYFNTLFYDVKCEKKARNIKKARPANLSAANQAL